MGRELEPTEVLLDACVLLNLVASGRLDEIRAANRMRFLVAETVAGESLYTERYEDGGVTHIPIDLQSLVDAGTLTLVALAPEELAMFLEIASEIDDGEAATIALARHRLISLATDDRGALRYIARSSTDATILAPITTAQLIRGWAAATGADAATVAEVIANIRSGARFEPGRRDPEFDWWKTASQDTGIGGGPAS